MADKEFLEYVVKAIVDNPSAVSVDRKVDEMGVLITLKTDPADMGKVIRTKRKHVPRLSEHF